MVIIPVLMAGHRVIEHIVALLDPIKMSGGGFQSFFTSEN